MCSEVHDMNMDPQHWCLPVYDGRVHPTVKFHYFATEKSLCGRHQHDIDFYETSMQDCEISFSSDEVCKQCLKRFLNLEKSLP